MDKPAYLSSFGRNRGRSLRPYQQGLIDTLLPKLEINLPPAGEIDLSRLMGARKKAGLEIGFGAGEHLLAQAMHHPDTLYLGCEPFINGVAKLLAGIDKAKLGNILLFTHDARLLVNALPDSCLDDIFILFPDPWPKTRHNKRRLINAETLSMLARVHKSGGKLLIATDHEDYLNWILERLMASPDYQWTAREKADWESLPKDWTETKYQRKTSAEGRAPVFLEYKRR